MQVKLSGVVCAMSLLIFSQYVGAETWTLAASIERSYQNAPEIKLAENEVEARQSAIDNSSFWPNPTVDVRVDNRLGLDDGSGDYNVNEIGISQPIPLNRLKYQKDFSQANKQVADHELEKQRLLLETVVAKEFHELQYAQAESRLAKQRLTLAAEMQAKFVKHKQSAMVRYMTPLEKMRLDILKEEAAQVESGAEGRYLETLTRFTKRLYLDQSPDKPAQDLMVADQIQLSTLPDVNYFLEQQRSHASLVAQQQSIIAARAEVDVAKSRQLNDPTIRLSREIDTFSQGKDEVYGITLNVQIPLWNNKNPDVSRAEYNSSQRNIELQKMIRELQIQVKQAHTHLGHLIQQAEHHRLKVLQPSAQILKLTNKGFSSGELNLLTLIDANNIYFDAQLRYSELIYQAWVEYADLRQAAGILYSKAPATHENTLKGAL